MERSELFTIRPYDPKGDCAFIFATYLRHLWFSPTNETTLAKDTFMRIHHGRMEQTLSKVPVHIACLKEDLDTILGYYIASEIPFIYIKKAWRDAGIDKLLKGTK